MRALLASQRSVRRRWLLRKRPKLVAATRPPRLDSAAAPQAAAPVLNFFYFSPDAEDRAGMPTAAARCAPHEPRGADDRVRIALSPPPLFLHAPPLLRPCAAGPPAPNRGALTLRKRNFATKLPRTTLVPVLVPVRASVVRRSVFLVSPVCHV